MLDTPPETSIFGDLRVKADQLSHGEEMAGQLTCLEVKAKYHIRKAMCSWKILEGQGWSPDHPGSRPCLFHFGLNFP